MACKLFSSIYIANMKSMCLFLIQNDKKTKITGQKVEMRFLGVVKYLRTVKYHHSVQHEKLYRIDTLFKSKEQT